MANQSIKSAFERMWQHVVAALEEKPSKNDLNESLTWKVVDSVKGSTQVDISSVVDIAHEFMVVVKFMGSSATELTTTHIVPNVPNDIQRNVQGYFYMPDDINLTSATTGCIVVTVNTVDNIVFLSGEDAWTKVWDSDNQYETTEAAVGVYYR